MTTLISVGTVQIDMGNPSIVLFPPVPAVQNRAYIFFLTKTSPSNLLEFGYVLILPGLVFDSTSAELGNYRLKYFDKGFSYSFPVSVPQGIDPPGFVIIGLKPIRFFSNTIPQPKILDFELQVLDTAQTVGYG